MTNGNPSLLAIENLTKTIASGGSRFTLEIERFELQRGQVYGITGRGGSGKSTMLDLISMVTRPSALESFRIATRPVSGDDTDQQFEAATCVGRDGHGAEPARAADDATISALRRSQFGYVLQSGGLFPFLTVRENLEIPFRLSGDPYDPALIVDLAGRLDIADQLDKEPSALSGGQRQRVSILRALVGRPPIILADEPTAAIDEFMAESVMSEFRDLARRQNATVVVVSHDVDLVSMFADAMIRLEPERDETDGSTTTRCVFPPRADVAHSQTVAAS